MGNELNQIIEFVNKHFSISDLRDLCLYLDVDYENLPVENLRKRSSIRELVIYLVRRDRLSNLLAALEIERPKLFAKSQLSLDVELSRKDSLTFLADEVINSNRFQADNNRYVYYPVPDHEYEINEHVGNELFSSHNNPVIMISGIGGIGKTAVAIEIIRRTLTHELTPFKKITWDSAKESFYEVGNRRQVGNAVISWDALFDSIGQQLVGTHWHKTPADDKENKLRDKLHEKRSLIVVDNLESLANADEIIFRIKGLLGFSKLLLTSREQVPGNYYNTKLEGLSLQSTKQFLEQEIKIRHLQLPVLSESDINEIHKATSGMPLALQLVIGQAEMLGLEVSLENFQAGRDDIYEYIFPQMLDKLSIGAQKIIFYLATNLRAIGREELEIVARKVDINPVELNNALTELIRASLIYKQDLLGTGKLGYRIHQLTRQFIIND